MEKVTVNFIEETSREIVNLVDAYERAGGELDFVFLKTENNQDENSFELSRNAAVCAMQIMAERIDDYYLNTLKLSPAERMKLYRINITNHSPEGRKVSLQQFFGPFFDYSNDRLLFVAKTAGRQAGYSAAGAVDNQEGAQITDVDAFKHLYQYHTIGYAQAFSSPPYNLRISKAKINHLFLAFNRIIFRGDTPYIVLWENNWSNYFDKGKDWWGSYFWTLYFSMKSRFVIIGASTID